MLFILVKLPSTGVFRIYTQIIQLSWSSRLRPFPSESCNLTRFCSSATAQVFLDIHLYPLAKLEYVGIACLRQSLDIVQRARAVNVCRTRCVSLASQWVPATEHAAMLPCSCLFTFPSYSLLLNLSSLLFLSVLCPLVVGDAEPCHARGHPGHS